ncbi:MAG: site-specific DNA-methyltransferase [Treponema sp.]|nr:site-specific DNA-methyltransferase [Treponema sp.]
MKNEKVRASRNRTLTLTDEDFDKFGPLLLNKTSFTKKLSIDEIQNKIINGDLFEVMDFLPEKSVDLMIIDPPYNLSKNFNGFKFEKRTSDSYLDYLESWFPKIIKLLKDNGSLYICGDWKCSSELYQVVSKYLIVRNRITWQREKGRGSSNNWKNCTEDIWFATKSDDYYFDVDAVKQKKKIFAPYKENGKPKDWVESEDGNYRLTYPSNFWDDISIPFWSMPENTDHPTQKPEKLIAKLILASSSPSAFVFDPFLGSGTTAVAAYKLNRNYCGIEINEEYSVLAQKRLWLAQDNKAIQGYENGIFKARNE